MQYARTCSRCSTKETHRNMKSCRFPGNRSGRSALPLSCKCTFCSKVNTVTVSVQYMTKY